MGLYFQNYETSVLIAVFPNLYANTSWIVGWHFLPKSVH